MKHPTSTNTSARRAAASMTGAAVLAIAGFTALGSIFSYPDILKEPTSVILALYREHSTAISAWFLVLAVGAALLAPAGTYLGRLAGGRLGRWIAVTGIAAATVQAIGLSRWVLFVPRLSEDATDPATRLNALSTFDQLHTWLGQALGETAGYALTATFTVLVLVALTRNGAPRWLLALGYASAVLVATGVLIPLGMQVAEVTNFAGYIAWSLWLLAFAALLWRPRVDLAPPAITQRSRALGHRG